MTNKVSQYSVRGHLLLATIDFLNKNKQASQNHGDIVLVLHLECWAEDEANQLFNDLDDRVCSLLLKLQSYLALGLLKNRVTKVFDVNATRH